jgi:hypothetical protein
MNRRPVLIEQTGRQYKAGCLVGGVAMAGGFFLLGWGSGELRSDLVEHIGAAVMLAGVATMLIAAFLGWWKHG